MPDVSFCNGAINSILYKQYLFENNHDLFCVIGTKLFLLSWLFHADERL